MSESKFTKDDIMKSLKKQLTHKNAHVDHFEDLINDYGRLWDIKEELREDINEKGAVYDEPLAKGGYSHRANPAVKEFRDANKQMLNILKELNLTTDNAGGEDEDM